MSPTMMDEISTMAAGPLVMATAARLFEASQTAKIPPYLRVVETLHRLVDAGQVTAAALVNKEFGGRTEILSRAFTKGIPFLEAKRYRIWVASQNLNRTEAVSEMLVHEGAHAFFGPPAEDLDSERFAWAMQVRYHEELILSGVTLDGKHYSLQRGDFTVWDEALDFFRDDPDSLLDWILEHKEYQGGVTRDWVLKNFREYGGIRKRTLLSRALFLDALIGSGVMSGQEERLGRPILDILEAVASDTNDLREVLNDIGEPVKTALPQLMRHSGEFSGRISRVPQLSVIGVMKPR